MVGRPPTPCRRAWYPLAALLVALVMGASVGAAAHAAPKPDAKELRRQLAKQQKELDALIGDYNAKRVALAAARKAEQATQARLRAAQRKYEQAQQGVRELVTLRYQQPDPNLAMFWGGADPSTTLSRAAILQQLAAEEAALVAGFAKARDDYADSAGDARRKVKDLSAVTAEVGERRGEAEDLIEGIKDKLDKLTTPTSRRSDGTWVPELPSGPDNITLRMRNVRDLIRQRFDLSYGVGCYRGANDGGEHPLGRACDFMLSSGGAMPSSEQARLGDEISAWVIENAQRLGIMYVIYKQRIWHVRTGAWKPMSDRGGVTANHYDHPHISVY
ncbi:coiled-coil domain-containing protein [Nonomuraea basaltis]|uniref:coiled-coil domain-containing protein n=1 Tax=Nonomuraea basaltis TaxID=2495887 RepID=UPI001F0FEE77|nr:hypothetical protein [Nonomuraea basaltis]